MIVGDDPALHFLNSVATPAGETVDWLADGEAFAAWLRAVQPPGTADAASREELSPEALDRVAGQARELRECSRRAIERWSAGDPQAFGSLAPLNAVLSADRTWRSLAVGGESVVWRTERERSDARWLLGPLAGAVGDLLVRGERARVRRCEGARCTLWFFDGSRPNRRRWCSMALCGNRAKVAAHRARSRS